LSFYPFRYSKLPEKFRSIEKLKRLNPHLALMLLRSSQIPIDRVQKKLNNFIPIFAVLSLLDKNIPDFCFLVHY